MNIGVGSKRCNTYIFHNNNRVAFLEIMQYRFSKKYIRNYSFCFVPPCLNYRRLHFCFFYTTLPNLQMCRNHHLLDSLISFYLIDK